MSSGILKARYNLKLERKCVVAYELGESHYRLVKNDIAGHIGRRKKAYNAIRDAIV